MVKEGQKVHGGRATLAVVTTPVLAIFLAIVVGFVSWSNLSRPIRNARITARVPAQSTQMAAALQIYLANNADRWPPHAAELIATNNIAASEFFTGYNADAESPIGNTTLSQLESLSDEDQQAAVQAAAAALPKKVTAHRVGDFVFTYHGVPRTDVQAPFWIFIFWPENTTITQEINNRINVGLLDGSTTTYKPEEFSQRLKEQNVLRTNAGLPRLVPPQFVTHTQPADPDCWVLDE